MARRSDPNPDVVIRIALPLPLDVTGSLLHGVAERYPDAEILADEQPDELVVTIPATNRTISAPASDPTPGGDPVSSETPSDGIETTPATLGSTEPADWLATVYDDRLSVSLPEWFASTFVGLARQILDAADAPNYLEITLADGKRRYPVIVCRPGAPGPHELRQQADERADRYAAKLRSMGLDPDAV